RNFGRPCRDFVQSSERTRLPRSRPRRADDPAGRIGALKAMALYASGGFRQGRNQGARSMDSASRANGFEERTVASVDGLALFARDYAPMLPVTGAPVL